MASCALPAARLPHERNQQASLAAAVLTVLAVVMLLAPIQLYSKSYIRATPPLRHIEVSPSRQENKTLDPLERAPCFAVFLLHSCFQFFSCRVRQLEARPSRYVECYIMFQNHSPSDSFLDNIYQNTRSRLHQECHRPCSGHKVSVF